MLKIVFGVSKSETLKQDQILLHTQSLPGYYLSVTLLRYHFLSTSAYDIGVIKRRLCKISYSNV